MSMQKRKNMNVSEKGFALVALIVFLVLSAVLFSVALHVTINIHEQSRVDETMEKLEAFKSAITMNPYLFHNEAGGNFGYVSQNQGFPGNLNDVPNHDIQGNHFTVSDVESNYMRLDGWGTGIGFTNVGTTFTLKSNTAGKSCSIDIDRRPFNGNIIAVQILDATPSGLLLQLDDPNLCTGVGAGDIPDYYNTDSGDYEGHIIFDDTDFDTVTITNQGGTTDVPTYWSGPQTFNVPGLQPGAYELYLEPSTDMCGGASGSDPHIEPDPWLDTDDATYNAVLRTTLFVPPRYDTVGGSAVTQTFNVIYPVIARMYVNPKDTGVASLCHDVEINGNKDSWTQSSEDTGSYHIIRVGEPENKHNQPMRGVFKIRGNQIAASAYYPDFTMGSSKISAAYLGLYTLASETVVSGGDVVRLYSFTGKDDGTWWTDANMPMWSDVSDEANDYIELQDQWRVIDSNGYHYFNITQAMQLWTSWDLPNHGLVLRMYPNASSAITVTEDTDNRWSFVAREHWRGGDVLPQIVIIYYP